ncbi:MAG: ATP-binding protein, partial [Candidatus Dormibacteria bacterium]
PAGELPELREALAVLLGVEGAGVERAQLFASWRRIFEFLGERGTVVMVIDDCQWADSGLLDFVESLLDWSADSPLLIITLARPELAERHPGWGTGRPTATALALEPLAPGEMSELLEGLVPGLPASTIARIVGAAEGIPLYAVELVRALAERGSLARRGERYALVGEVEELPVPASLTALLAARLDTLSPRSRTLASRLSVFAGAIPPAAARAVAGMPEAEMEASLAELRRAEVLAVRTDALAADRGQFVFTQGLLRSAAYDRLGRAERRAAHLEAASYLQGALPDSGLEVAEAVAGHLEAALEVTAAGDDAASLRASAAEAFARAGARARAVGAPASSQRSYQRARRLAPESPDAIAWQAQAAEAAADAGDYEAALEEAASPASVLNSTSPEITSLAILRSRALRGQGRTDEAVEELRRALAARARLDPDEQSARLHGEFAYFLFMAGEAEAADAEAELALAEGQAYEVPHAVARGAEVRAWGLTLRGRVEEALLHLEWCARLTTANGTLRDQARVTMNVGDLEAQYDRPGAVGHFESGFALSRRAGARDLLPVAVSNLAWVWGLTGRWREAEQLTSELLADISSVQDRAFLIFSVGWIQLWRGDVKAAAEQLSAAMPLPSGTEVQLKGALDALDCAIRLAQRKPRDALALAEQVLAPHTSALGISHQAVRQLWTEAVEAAIRCGAHELAGRWLSRFLTDHLAGERNLSPQTISSYRDAIKLLLTWFRD